MACRRPPANPASNARYVFQRTIDGPSTGQASKIPRQAQPPGPRATGCESSQATAAHLRRQPPQNRGAWGAPKGNGCWGRRIRLAMGCAPQR